LVVPHLVGGFTTSGVEARGNTPAVVVIDDTVNGISGALSGHPEEAGSRDNTDELQHTRKTLLKPN
jgi:hypothetical protein